MIPKRFCNRHLNIGAGRIVWQDIVRIDQSIKKRTFHKSENIVASCQRAKDGNGRLHLLGLVRVRLNAYFMRGSILFHRCPMAAFIPISAIYLHFLRPQRKLVCLMFTFISLAMVSKYYLHTQFTQLTAIKGRDTAPRSATGYAKELIEFIEKEKIGEIGDFFRLFWSHSCALISYSDPDCRTSYCGR